MRQIEYNIDINKSSYNYKVCMQNDDLEIKVNVYNNSLAYDLTNSTINLNWVVPDGTPLTKNNLEKENNVVIIKLNNDFTEIKGKAKFELEIINDGKMTTFPLEIVIVQKSFQSEAVNNKIIEVLETIQMDEYIDEFLDGIKKKQTELSSQMDDNENITKNIVSVLNFNVITNSDDDMSLYIQNAIDSISSSAWTGKNGGIVYIPSGVYHISKIYLKSGVIIKGDRNTFLVPIGEDYCIDTEPLAAPSRHHGCGIENIVICSSSVDKIQSQFNYGYKGKGIRLQSGNGQEYIRNIAIYGLEEGLCLENEFDTHISNVEVIGCNHNVILKTNDRETTNAINIDGLRSEKGVTTDLQIIDGALSKKSQCRSIQFSNCKFEGYSKIKINGARDVKFIGTNFVRNPRILDDDNSTENYLSDEYWIEIFDKDTSLGTQCDGIQFIGCSFFASGGKKLYIKNYTNEFPVTIDGCFIANCCEKGFAGHIKISNGTIQTADKNALNISSCKNVTKIGMTTKDINIVEPYTAFANYAGFYNMTTETIHTSLDAKFILNNRYLNTFTSNIDVYLLIKYKGNFEIGLGGKSLGVKYATDTVNYNYDYIRLTVKPGENMIVKGTDGNVEIVNTTCYVN